MQITIQGLVNMKNLLRTILFTLAVGQGWAMEDNSVTEDFAERSSNLEQLPQSLLKEIIKITEQTVNLILEAEKLAESDDPAGCFILGVSYLQNDDTEVKGAKLIEKAADLGHIDACFIFGLMVQQNYFGIQRNYDRAIKYLTKAFEGKHPQAPGMLANLYLTNHEIEANIPYCIQLLEKSVEFDDPTGLTLYGILLKNGEFISQNFPKAHKYFSRAAAKDHAYAYTMLGVMYHAGEGVNLDYQKAVQYYQKAIQLDATEDQALVNLAMMHYEGKGVSIDPLTCKSLLIRAANEGNLMAQRNLSHFLIEGIFLNKDVKLGIKFLQMAAAQGDIQCLLKLLNLQNSLPKKFFE